MSNSEYPPVRVVAPRLTQDEDGPDGDPVEIQRLLAWYFRGDDAARHGGRDGDLRDAA
ncbi:MAG TPA: hypothetical protein VFH74_04420 [Gaiellales bacterium]|nr:hypothetical protein [Gaiellales bacterium]